MAIFVGEIQYMFAIWYRVRDSEKTELSVGDMFNICWRYDVEFVI